MGQPLIPDLCVRCGEQYAEDGLDVCLDCTLSCIECEGPGPTNVFGLCPGCEGVLADDSLGLGDDLDGAAQGVGLEQAPDLSL